MSKRTLKGMVHMITMLISIAHIDIGEYKQTCKYLETTPQYPVLASFFPRYEREIPKNIPDNPPKIVPEYPTKKKMPGCLYSHLSSIIFGISEKIPENMPKVWGKKTYFTKKILVNHKSQISPR